MGTRREGAKARRIHWSTSKMSHPRIQQCAVRPRHCVMRKRALYVASIRLVLNKDASMPATGNPPLRHQSPHLGSSNRLLAQKRCVTRHRGKSAPILVVLRSLEHYGLVIFIQRRRRGILEPNEHTDNRPHHCRLTHPFLFGLAATGVDVGVLAACLSPQSDASHWSRFLHTSIKPTTTLYVWIWSVPSMIMLRIANLFSHTFSVPSESGLTPVVWYAFWRFSSSSSAS